jgi:hypothetical protein
MTVVRTILPEQLVAILLLIAQVWLGALPLGFRGQTLCVPTGCEHAACEGAVGRIMLCDAHCEAHCDDHCDEACDVACDEACDEACDDWGVDQVGADSDRAEELPSSTDLSLDTACEADRCACHLHLQMPNPLPFACGSSAGSCGGGSMHRGSGDGDRISVWFALPVSIELSSLDLPSAILVWVDDLERGPSAPSAPPSANAVCALEARASVVRAAVRTV